MMMWQLLILLLLGTPNSAAIVIDFGTGETETHCVTFAEETISGYDLLQKSGVPLIINASSGMGSAICQVGAVGCSADDCFCQCKGGSDCTYWNYWLVQNGKWIHSAVGASSYQIKPNEINAWVWGDGEPTLSADSFAEICKESAAQGEKSADSPNQPKTAYLPYLAFGAIVTVLIGATILIRPKRHE